jgi:short subunit fatty acids transporter
VAPDPEEQTGVVARLAIALTAWTEKWLPDAFIFALVFTAVVVVAAITMTPASPAEVVDAWGLGFWELIPFTLQMALIIITGHVLATSPPTCTTDACRTGGDARSLGSYPAVPVLRRNRRHHHCDRAERSNAHVFVSASNQTTFPAVVAVYSAALGIFVPSGGSKWVIEAPYVMAAAHDLKVHLGWVVASYDLGEALANLIQPFWMLPILGIFQLRARDVMGYTFVVFLGLVPVVLLLVTLLGRTLPYPL